jgi:hypothetical protein
MDLSLANNTCGHTEYKKLRITVPFANLLVNNMVTEILNTIMQAVSCK